MFYTPGHTIVAGMNRVHLSLRSRRAGEDSRQRDRRRRDRVGPAGYAVGEVDIRMRNPGDA